MSCRSWQDFCPCRLRPRDTGAPVFAINDGSALGRQTLLVLPMLAIVDLSPAAQFWVNLVLIWIGFGTLAGLLARALLPTREPTGATATVVAGIVGSAIGLGALAAVFPHPQFNPITPLGLAAAAGGALLLLVAYRLARQSRGPNSRPSATRPASGDSAEYHPQQ